MLTKLVSVENVTRPISGSLILKTSVIKSKVGFSRAKAKTVRKILKKKFPSATRFLAAMPPIEPNNILMVVPVSEPSTIAAAGAKPIAPA